MCLLFVYWCYYCFDLIDYCWAWILMFVWCYLIGGLWLLVDLDVVLFAVLVLFGWVVFCCLVLLASLFGSLLFVLWCFTGCSVWNLSFVLFVVVWVCCICLFLCAALICRCSPLLISCLMFGLICLTIDGSFISGWNLGCGLSGGCLILIWLLLCLVLLVLWFPLCFNSNCSHCCFWFRVYY